jgi:sec-independent protein translocase protein TatA
MPTLLAVFGLGPWELMIFAFVVLLLFGNRLPSVMRSLGKGVVEFKKGVSGIEDEQPAEPSREQAVKGDHQNSAT